MYITPRVLIQQEFTQLPVYREFPLPAFILGPQYALTRYSEASEKPFTALTTLDGAPTADGNEYQTDTDTVYDFPNVPAGGAVDADYSKLYAEAVTAQYFPNAELGSTTSHDDVVLVEGPAGQTYTNKVRFANLVLKSTEGYDREDYFADRDVSVGDTIKVTDDNGLSVSAKITALTPEDGSMNNALAAVVAPVIASGADATASNSTTLTCAGAAFVASEVVGQYITITGKGVFKILARPNATTLKLNAKVTAAGAGYHIGGTYNDPSNAAAAVEDYNNAPTLTAGSVPAGVTVSNTSTAYKGYAASKILSDTYTVTVTTAGKVGTSTVLFSVSSAAGAFAAKTSQALTAGALTVDNANGNDVELTFADSGSNTIPLGLTWTVAVVAPVTQVDPVVSVAVYTGPSDMVYKLLVERGGAFYNGSNGESCARIVVSASNIDTSTVVLPRSATAFNIGSYGTKVNFAAASNNGGLIAGDAYYVPVQAELVGKVNVVEFASDMAEAMVSLGSTFTATLSLVQASINIPAVRDLLADSRNWTQDGNYITVTSGITSYDSRLHILGTPARLNVTSAKLFAEHRDLLQDNINAIGSLRDLASVTRELGTVHPDNPLAQGVYDAVLNSNNQVVYYIGVETDDLEGYTQAIKISEKSDKVYGFVPLTFDRTVQDAVVSHVNAYSTPEVGRWRVAWLSVQDKRTAVTYDLKENGDPFSITITDDPSITGTQYKLVTMPDATFIADGVRPNDKVRVNFKLNSDGVLVYDEYTVDTVRTQTSLTLTRALAAPINSLTKAQIVRVYTKSERATNIAFVGGEFNNRRVRCVFPDSFKYGGVTKQGYFAAAGLAGLRAGVVPHQGLTNTEYLGADDLSKVVVEFSQDDLNTMAEQGIWLLTQEVVGATPYVRHQLTTDESSLNTSEDSITTNVDSISYALKHTLEPFIGRFNVNIENVAVVRAAIVAELSFRATSTRTARAGNQLVSFVPKDDIIRLEQNSTYKDRIDCEVRLNVPYPMNYINLKLVV